MARPAVRYVCHSCGSVFAKWAGQCPDCNDWNCLHQEAAQVVTPFSAKHSLSGGGKKLELASLAHDTQPPPRTSTGISELDLALGGGLVAASAVLIGGDPGIGKSTLLLQAAGRMANAGHQVAYISGEEAADQIRLRAQRLGLTKAPVALASATSVRDILTTLSAGPPPALLIIDSIQTMHSDLLEGAPGTVSQVRAASQELIRYAKTSGCALILVGHVTKDGQIAGPRVLEHMVDTVLYFEGERSHQYRVLRAVKNRFGGTDEIGVFAMGAGGLEEVKNPSSLFLTSRDAPVSGSVVFPALEGTRPVMVEIQALVVRLATGATPRRAVVGWDSGRLAMVLAVLEARCGINFSSCEVYLNVAGGLRISDPAADLAVAAALVSALAESPVAAGTVVMGEIALSGEVRQASHPGVRLKEAAKLGFDAAMMPAGQKSTVKTIGIATLGQLVDQITGRCRLELKKSRMTSFDVIILIILGWGAVAGLMRGFVTEVLSLIAWVAAVAVLRLLHTPATALFGKWTHTETGGAILAFVVLFAATFYLFKGVARSLGARTRSSIVGPIDRVLGLGFGALKGLIVASLLFLLINLFFDMVWGADAPKPVWVTNSKTTLLLRLSSAAITDFVEKRRHPGAPASQQGYADQAREALSDLAEKAVPAK